MYITNKPGPDLALLIWHVTTMRDVNYVLQLSGVSVSETLFQHTKSRSTEQRMGQSNTSYQIIGRSEATEVKDNFISPN
mgnify:CR=1 FL=1